MIGRKLGPWLAATAIGVLSTASIQSASAVDRERPCNGSAELCAKRLGQVALPGTHNSMSNDQDGWALPNQHYSIPTQLEMGIRALLIDTHYGKPVGDIVQNWNSSTDGDPRAEGAPTYLCHEHCALGASGLASELARVAAFLRDNPREVLVFVVQNGIDPADYAKAVTKSGLIDHVYTGTTDTFPTLRRMIAADQRVVMLSEGSTGNVSWFHDGYAGPLQETPYDFRRTEAGDPLTTRQGMDQLIDPASLDSTCRPFRGGTTGSLFLMNHWVNGLLDNSNTVMPDPAVARVLNRPQVLIARARACEQRRGKLPNIVAVDDFGDGDLLGAVRELNGVIARPFFELRKPRRKKVRAGQRLAFRVVISNFGDLASRPTRVCALVPRRLAFRPRCRVVSVPRGNPGRAAVTIRFRTRRRARGLGAVRFRVAGPGARAWTGTAVRVRPIRRWVRKNSWPRSNRRN